MFRTLLGKNSIVIVVSRGVIAKYIQCQVKKVIESSAVSRTKNLKGITVCLAKAALLVNIFIISLIIVVLEELLQSVSSIR